MSGRGSPDGSREPSVDVIEALVRSIAAREAGVADAPRGAASIEVVAPGPADAPAPSRSAAAAPVARPLPAQHHERTASPPGPIAGLISRLEWERLVADESERQRRYGRPSVIVIAEVVGSGSAAGPGASAPAIVGRVIPACAEALLSLTRTSDRVTRLSDARLGILLRESDAGGASRYAARAIAACDPWLEAMPWSLRLVTGWASLDGADPAAALRAADGRLAKSSGALRRDRP